MEKIDIQVDLQGSEDGDQELYSYQSIVVPREQQEIVLPYLVRREFDLLNLQLIVGKVIYYCSNSDGEVRVVLKCFTQTHHA